MLLTFEAFGTTVLSRDLLRIGHRAMNMSPILEDVRDDFLRLERRLFDSEGSSGGHGWDPLSEPYGSWKQEHYPGRGILERDMHLRESLTEKSSPWGDSRVTDEEMVVVSRVPYAPFHQRGTRRMPARPPVQLSEVDKRRWIKMLQRYVILGHRGGAVLSGLLGDVF